MFYLLIVLGIIVCIFLGFFILIQEPKGGGLTSGFAGTNNIMGVQRTGDFLEKGTWSLIIALMVISLLINVMIPKGAANHNKEGEEIQRQLNRSLPTVPVTPSALPGATAPADSNKK